MHVPDPALLLEHRGFVRSLARGVLRGAEDVDDAEQDTWLAALTQPAPAPGRLRAWLGSIGRRRALDRHRRATTRARHEAAVPPRPATASTADLVAQADLGRWLAEAVLGLDAPSRDALLLRYYEGLAPREVAARLGLPLDNVRTRLRRGLDRLRSRLDPRDEARRRNLLALAGVPAAAAPPGGASALRVGVAAAVVGLGVTVALRLPADPERGPATDADVNVAAAAPLPAVTLAAAPRIGPAAAAAPAGPPPAAPLPAPAPPAAEPPAPTSGTTKLTISVRDADGAPIAGARVGSSVGARDGRAPEATTDAGGVALADLSRDGRGAIRPDELTISATGFATAVRRVDAWPRAEEPRLEVVLVAGTPLRGRVVDARDERPVPGARVRVVHGGTVGARSDSAFGFVSYGTADAGPDGRFVVAGVPLDVIVTVLVDQPGWDRAPTPVLVPKVATPDVDVRTTPAGTLRVRVVAPDGAPVAGADVLAIVPGLASYGSPTGRSELVPQGHGEDPRPEQAWLAPSLAGRTDPTGRVALGGVPFGVAARVRALARGWRRTDEVAVPPLTAERPFGDVELRMLAPSRVALTVVGPDGGAVASPRFSVDGEPVLDPDVADVAGPAVLTDLAPGRRRVVVEADGLVPAVVDVEAGPGATVERVVRLEAGVAIEGRVLDGSGRPFVDQTVYATEVAEGEGARRDVGVVTDATGRFRLGGLRPGPYDLDASDDATVDDGPRRVVAPVRNVELVLRRRARATLRLEPPAGRAAPTSAYVVTVAADGTRTGHEVDEGPSLDVPLPEDTRALRVSVAGYLPIERPVTATPGTIVELGAIALDPGAELEGTVRDAAGAPVAEASVTVGTGPPSGWDVTCATDETAFESVRTDAGGRFRRPTFPRGPAWVVVEAEGFLRSVVAADGRAGAPVTVVLRRGGVLRVVVVDAAGRALAGLGLDVQRAGDGAGAEAGWTTDGAGRRDVRVPAGRYRVHVLDGEGETLATADAEVADGATRDVSVKLR